MPFVQGGVGLVANLILGPIFIAVGLFVWAGILHLLLLLMGGGARGFEATFRVVAYASRRNLIQIVPDVRRPHRRSLRDRARDHRALRGARRLEGQGGGGGAAPAGPVLLLLRFSRSLGLVGGIASLANHVR